MCAVLMEHCKNYPDLPYFSLATYQRHDFRFKQLLDLLATGVTGMVNFDLESIIVHLRAVIEMRLLVQHL